MIAHRVARRPVCSPPSRSGVAGALLALAVLLPATAVAEEPARKDVLLLYADSMLRFYTEALDSRGS